MRPAELVTRLASAEAQVKQLRERSARAEARAERAEARAREWEDSWAELAGHIDDFLRAREAKGTPDWYHRYRASRAELYEELGR